MSKITERMIRDPLFLISTGLLMIGGLNYLLISFGVNVVELLLGSPDTSIMTKLVYIIIGLSAIYLLYPMYLFITWADD